MCLPISLKICIINYRHSHNGSLSLLRNTFKMLVLYENNAGLEKEKRVERWPCFSLLQLLKHFSSAIVFSLPRHSPGNIWQKQWCPLLVLLGCIVLRFLMCLCTLWCVIAYSSLCWAPVHKKGFQEIIAQVAAKACSNHGPWEPWLDTTDLYQPWSTSSRPQCELSEQKLNGKTKCRQLHNL